MTELIEEISATELQQVIKNQEDICILDVREAKEFKICNIGGTLISLQQLPGRLSELDPSKTTIIHCRSGRRSLMVAEFLQAHGFHSVKNLTGGILAWIRDVDPTLQKY